MSYTIPKTLLGSDSSGKLSFSTDGSKYALNSGEGFIGYKSNLGTYYQNAFVFDTNSTTPVVFSTNSTPAFSLSSNANLALFGNVLKGSLNVGDTNVPDFGNYYVPLGDAYFTSLIIGAGQKGGALERTVSHELELRAGTNAQAFQIYNTYTDASNYERLEIKWDTNIATIATTAAGTGAARNLRVEANLIDLDSASSVRVKKTGTTQFTFDTNGIYPNIATRDCGTSANRWENVHSQKLLLGDGVDAVLTADAADTLALRNSTNAQQFNVYNTYTDASNYERLEVKWDTNVAKIETTAAGTGTQRDLEFEADAFVFRRGGTIRFEIDNQLGTAKFGQGVTVLPSANKNASLGTVSNRWYSIYTAGLNTDVQTVTASSDTLGSTDHVVLCDCTSNAITINLPAAQSGRQYHIKKIDSSSNTVTIDGNGAETIDGALTQVISAQYESITIVCDGSNWHII